MIHIDNLSKITLPACSEGTFELTHTGTDLCIVLVRGALGCILAIRDDDADWAWKRYDGSYSQEVRDTIDLFIEEIDAVLADAEGASDDVLYA
jgi:hypothetical protein